MIHLSNLLIKTSMVGPITKERLKFIAYPPETETPWKAFDLTKAVELK